MKRHQSGAEKRKKLKKQLEIAESQRNALHKFLTVNSETELPSTSTLDSLVSVSFETTSELNNNVESTEVVELIDNEEVMNAAEKDSENTHFQDMPESSNVNTKVINDIAL